MRRMIILSFFFVALVFSLGSLSNVSRASYSSTATFGGLPGDLNGDGKVDMRDVAIWAHWTSAIGVNINWSSWFSNAPGGDYNISSGTYYEWETAPNGVSYSDDLRLIMANFGLCANKMQIFPVTVQVVNNRFGEPPASDAEDIVNITAAVGNADSCVLCYENGNSWAYGTPCWTNVTMTQNGSDWNVIINANPLPSGWNFLPPIGWRLGYEFRIYTESNGHLMASPNYVFYYAISYSCIDP